MKTEKSEEEEKKNFRGESSKKETKNFQLTNLNGRSDLKSPKIS